MRSNLWKIVIISSLIFKNATAESANKEIKPFVFLDALLWNDLQKNSNDPDDTSVAQLDVVYDYLPFRKEIKIVENERACYDRLFQITKSLSEKNNLLVSVILNQALIKQNPDNPGYIFELGRTYYKMQSWSKAADTLRQALALDPQNVDVKLILAYVLLAQYTSKDDLHESRRYFLEVVQAMPSYEDAQTGLRRVEILLGLQPKPIAGPVPPKEEEGTEPVWYYTDEKVTEFMLYASLEHKDTEKPQYYYESGRYYAKIEAWDQAINAFNKALELQPDNLDVKVQLGYAHLFRYTTQAQLVESRHLFQQVLEAVPGYVDARTGLARVDALLKGETPKKVIESPLEKKKESQEDFCRAILVETAQQLTEQKNYWGAILLYQELIKLYPNNAEYYYQLGRLYASAQSWENAIDAFNHSLKLQPDNADARLGAAYGYLLRYTSRCDLYDSESLFEDILGGFPYYQDAQEGLRRVKNLLRLLPQHGVEPPQPEEKPKPDPEQEEIEKKKALLIEWQRQAEKIAKHLSDLKDYDGAAQLYLDLIDAFPDISDYYFELGVQYARMERRCEAITAFRKALELKPTHSDALVALGNQYLFFNCYGFSYELFNRAVAAAPKDPNTWLGLARTEALLDLNCSAETHFQQAAELEPENTDFLKPYASFLLSQKRFIESETFYQGIVSLENNEDPYRSTLFYIGGYTNPSFYAKGGGVVEMEKTCSTKGGRHP